MAARGALYEELRPQDERTALLQFLDVYRADIVAKVAGVADEQASRRVLRATKMTIGGIVKHLAWSEDSWFQGKLLGAPVPEPWASSPIAVELDWPFESAHEDAVADLIALYSAACDRSRAAVEQCRSLDALAARESFGDGPVNLRWLLVHMIDETARHAGHLDLLLDEVAHQR